MENNKKLNFASIAIDIVVILIAIAIAFFAIKSINPAIPEVPSQANQDGNLKTDLYKKVTNPTNYGSPISTDVGFGRENPFAPY